MIVPGKLQNLDYSRYLRFQEKLRKKRKELLLFVEHPACITAGTTFQKNNLLFSESLLTRKKIGFY
ncbi:MAG: hypothetical protein KDK45_19285, partial [Leptospiraceae bacterium]|nr:hypothetical protein [Leptospiraceae bacterium]